MKSNKRLIILITWLVALSFATGIVTEDQYFSVVPTQQYQGVVAYVKPLTYGGYNVTAISTSSTISIVLNKPAIVGENIGIIIGQSMNSFPLLVSQRTFELVYLNGTLVKSVLPSPNYVPFGLLLCWSFTLISLAVMWMLPKYFIWKERKLEEKQELKKLA